MGTRTQAQTGHATQQIDPMKIMNTGMGFFSSKTLLTAVKLNLFTLLEKRPLTRDEIKAELGLQGRGLYDFLDSLVALGFLNREGIRKEARYLNAEDTSLFLDKSKPTYIGGILEMSNNRLYPIWNNLENGLKTGRPQNEILTGGDSLFDVLYQDMDKMREFIRGMDGFQTGNFLALTAAFDFSKYRTLCDIGGAGARLSMTVISQHPHMKCISLDLPAACIVARENVKAAHLEDKIDIREGDFFEDPFPKADIITMGNILQDWGTTDKKTLIRKAYEALPEGGSLVAIETILDDERKENDFGLLMSLNMLLETPHGYDMTAGTFDCFTREAGFSDSYIIPLAGPVSAAVAVK